MSRNNQRVDLDIRPAYRKYDRDLRRKRLNIILYLGIVFIMGFTILDLVIYPNLVLQMISVRIISVLLLIFFIIIIKNEKWSKNIEIIGLLVPCTAFVMIDMLVFITEGSKSPYYAGLILTMVASSALMAWTFFESVLVCIIMLLFYMITLLIHSNFTFSDYENPIFINNMFFLVTVSIFCAVASYLNNKLRFREFCLNYSLDYNLKKETMRLRSTQSQLIQSEKINAIGSLSAGLLHEVNNPLNYTMTALQLIKMDPAVNADEDLKDTVKDIEEGMTRIKNIVSDLRAFAYPEEADKTVQFPIREAVESALRFTASENKDIEKIVNVSSDLIVSASKTHIVQVLINLVSNATKAINKADREKGVIKIDAIEENGRIKISVSDNGTGMNEETLRKVFDPFFTTNEVGKGMGLGLSVSHTIIKNHGGNLSAESVFGEGSKFYFDLGGL